MRDTYFIKFYTDQLKLKNYSENTIKSYNYHLNCFFDFKKDIQIDKLSSQDINDYLNKISEDNFGFSYQNQAINSIKFFFKYCLNRKVKDYLVIRAKKEEKLPKILSIEEVQRIINSISNTKHKAIVLLLYSTGMRVSEIINLKIKDIDRDRMVINIIDGKGKIDRTVPLKENVLKFLREYYKEYRTKIYLFEGQIKEQYTAESIRSFLKKYANISGIKKEVYPHIFRHSFATHSLEIGIDLKIIKQILGHKNIKTTEIYTQVSNNLINKIINPVDSLIF